MLKAMKNNSSFEKPVFFLFSAVSDAIRTSLGPRGMDKMVKHRLILKFILNWNPFIRLKYQNCTNFRSKPEMVRSQSQTTVQQF